WSRDGGPHRRGVPPPSNRGGLDPPRGTARHDPRAFGSPRILGTPREHPLPSLQRRFGGRPRHRPASLRDAHRLQPHRPGRLVGRNSSLPRNGTLVPLVGRQRERDGVPERQHRTVRDVHRGIVRFGNGARVRPVGSRARLQRERDGCRTVEPNEHLDRRSPLVVGGRCRTEPYGTRERGRPRRHGHRRRTSVHRGGYLGRRRPFYGRRSCIGPLLGRPPVLGRGICPLRGRERRRWQFRQRLGRGGPLRWDRPRGGHYPGQLRGGGWGPGRVHRGCREQTGRGGDAVRLLERYCRSGPHFPGVSQRDPVLLHVHRTGDPGGPLRRVPSPTRRDIGEHRPLRERRDRATTIGDARRIGGGGGQHRARPVHLSGGALPISLTWNLSGNRSGGAETVGSDGSGVLRVPLGVAGEYTLGVRASDALGDMGTSVTATVWVDPPLDANVTGARSLVSYGAVAEVAGEVLSGCPPFSWWVVPDLEPANGSPGNGTLPDVGAFSWNGSYDQEGNLSLTAGVADGCGATWRTGLEVPLIPILSAEVAVASGPTSPNETLAVNLSVQGGQSPFQLYVNASDNESWNRTLPSDGTYRWLFPAHANGSLEVLVSVTDRLGKDLETHLTVALIAPAEPTVPPPPPSTLPGPFGNSTTTAPMDPTWLLLALIPAGGIATVVFLRGRRARKTRGETPGPDP